MNVFIIRILNNNYALSNLIRLGKIEQVYSQLQIKTKDIPDERMITLERHLAGLVEAFTQLESVPSTFGTAAAVGPIPK